MTLEEENMVKSVYKIIEVVGTSTESWVAAHPATATRV
jgi:flavin-binding protein dodecin